MKRFVFSMQALYDVKKAKEKQTLTEYAAAHDALQTLEDKERACRQEILQEQTHLEERAKCGIFACDFQNARTYLGGMRQKAAALEQDVRGARQNAARLQQMLQKIYQEKKALERLRDAQYRDFMAEEHAKEAKATEDLLVFGMLNKMMKQDNPA